MKKNIMNFFILDFRYSNDNSIVDNRKKIDESLWGENADRTWSEVLYTCSKHSPTGQNIQPYSLASLVICIYLQVGMFLFGLVLPWSSAL
jgi:hypothetical protein